MSLRMHRNLFGLTALCFSTLLFPTNVSQAQETTAAVNQGSSQDPSSEKTEAKTKPKREPLYDEAADPEVVIAAALEKAKKENQRVLVQWGANWCGWCYLLHDKMKQDPAIARKLNYEYQVVLVDIGRFDKCKDLMAKYEADVSGNGVPFLTVLDADGNVVTNQETSSLESKEEGKKEHDGEAVLAFLEQYQPEPVDAQTVLDKAFDQAAESDRLVILHFGAPWCGWCHYLENWLEEEPQTIIHEKLLDVKIDTDRATGGSELMLKYSKKQQGIPWFAILDPKTKEVIVDSTGPGGNVGFPSTDDEIAYFGTMLEACGDRFTTEEIESLKDSLVNNRQEREAAMEERRRKMAEEKAAAKAKVAAEAKAAAEANEKDDDR